MRYTVLALLAGVVILPTSAFAQQIEIGPGGIRVEPPRSEHCRELREACIHKEELGEVGEGNCRRYRESCRERFWR